MEKGGITETQKLKLGLLLEDLAEAHRSRTRIIKIYAYNRANLPV